jgi:hypothetical protein
MSDPGFVTIPSYFIFRARDECDPEASKEICDTEEDMDQEMTGVKISFPMSYNSLIGVVGLIQ